jgi:DNA-binding NarL/FixJ family response regulator
MALRQGVVMASADAFHSSVRILLVDDFEPFRQQVCSILGTRPELRVVAEVGDGLEAVQKAEELKPDLILLDIGLPGLDGLEAANHIREVAPDSAVIFLTQNSDKDVVRAALSTGAQGYVLKIDAGSELLPAVAGVLGGDDFVSSGINWGDSGETDNV